jgi:hypothetical protein
LRARCPESEKILLTNLGDSSSAADVLKALKREMAVFEATGKRPSSLEQLQNAVATLPPTSIEAERAFSARIEAERAFSARQKELSVRWACLLPSCAPV